ncbi:MAG: phosphatidate cytidylyltransferase, partial [Clostridium sp.]
MKSDNRYLGASMIAPFIIFIFLGGPYLKGLTIVLSVFGLYEFYNALKQKEFNPISIVGYVLLALFYITNNNFETLMFVLIIGAVSLLCVPIINLKYTFIDVAITLLGFIYVVVLFSFIPLVNSKVGGAYLVWLIF